MLGGKEGPRGEVLGDARRDALEADAVRRVLVGGDGVLGVVLAEQTRVAELGARLAHDRLDEIQCGVDGSIAGDKDRSLGTRQPLLQLAKEPRPDALLRGAL